MFLTVYFDLRLWISGLWIWFFLGNFATFFNT